MSAAFERYFKRGEPYAVLSVGQLGATPPDARARSQIAGWANQPRVRRFSKQLCVASATVIARPWERRALTALQWLWAPVSPHQAVDTVSQGVNYCISRLVERGVELPARPDLFEIRLNRSLAARPLAGLAIEPSDGSAGVESTRQSSSSPDVTMKTLSDRGGSVSIGWVAESVLWARSSGHLSAGLGASYAVELEQRFSRATQIRYFSDASSLESYDLLARSAVLSVLNAHRGRLLFALFLNWNGDVSAVAKAIAASMGSWLETTTNRPDFEARLFREAPLAKARLDAWHASGPGPSQPPLVLRGGEHQPVEADPTRPRRS